MNFSSISSFSSSSSSPSFSFPPFSSSLSFYTHLVGANLKDVTKQILQLVGEKIWDNVIAVQHAGMLVRQAVGRKRQLATQHHIQTHASAPRTQSESQEEEKKRNEKEKREKKKTGGQRQKSETEQEKKKRDTYALQMSTSLP